ncbi:MAG: preprotein translocase subunit SecE [Candidatus Chisholmbacteria bacterium RIFCSPHIGHO2_12_FULL_49_9]|uniref:Protein translocase subunit SecE n=1 Tax=Candidatus Chisholmbacteria bacterium RIFCSPHIGHO2_01_FULL_52_32 TaxID=1797591 RepID=A0A1G1VRX8_9BACT|nr:MAG: preprotein translocase subunit SecE [Candidatus Chisholmbacteria bacterium RIFCSPHIGHO2_12_FULL_49_9]OGY18158.1 MAG: preprotein translocase subunit SecE [Candidatus Chisholmbacteria bacterium RIFCSPHIGHO2_01_FULL_52_32]OGY20469.1 MAG: preprotein translocase subunit SecE [Candidatus Chisholmbacteria bacterium RIFCSPLOWO2_01_FULL_50_28]
MDRQQFSIAKPSLGNTSPIQFIRQSIEELKKVSWPTRTETAKLTLIVIAVSVAVGLYIGALDFLFTKLVELIIQ